MRRKDTWRGTLTVEGVLVGVCRAIEGRDVESSNLKVRNGGMTPEESLGGVKTRNDATLRLSYTQRIHELTPWLERRAGNAQCQVMEQPLNGEAVPLGGPRTLIGVLINVKPPDIDADGTDDPAELEVDVSLNEEAT